MDWGLDWLKGAKKEMWAGYQHPSLPASHCSCTVLSCLTLPWLPMLLSLPRLLSTQTMSWNRPFLPQVAFAKYFITVMRNLTSTLGFVPESLIDRELRPLTTECTVSPVLFPGRCGKNLHRVMIKTDKVLPQSSSLLEKEKKKKPIYSGNWQLTLVLKKNSKVNFLRDAA